MSTKESDVMQDKERPAGSQSLFRGLMLMRSSVTIRTVVHWHTCLNWRG